MKTLRARIGSIARQRGVDQHVIEKDYAIGYILAGIYEQEILREELVFKGGTALAKLFFTNYRFSEDLDFSARGLFDGVDWKAQLSKAVSKAERLMLAQGLFSLQIERYRETQPHPRGQEAFINRVQFPWHPRPHCRIKIEITRDEPIMLEPEWRRLQHGYQEELECDVQCYQLEEIVAEKLRTLLQTHQKLIERGWNQPRARDYYDLWRILVELGAGLDKDETARILRAKCDHRSVSFHKADDFFTPQLIDEAAKNWEASLDQFVDELPDFEEVLGILQYLIRGIVGGAA